MYLYNLISPIAYYLFLNILGFPKKKRQQIIVTIMMIQLFVFWSFFKYDTFPDVGYYNEYYRFLTEYSIDGFYKFSRYVDTEYGYLLFNKILTFIHDNPRTLYIVRSLIQVIIIGYVLRQYSSNIFLSILLFLLTFGVNQSIFVVRQYFALTIFFLSIEFILKKNLLKFLFVFFVSFSIHKSMIIFLPLYFLYNYIDLNEGNYKKIIIYALLIIVVLKPLISLVSSYLNLYESYTNSDTTEGLASSGMFFRSLMFLLPLIYVLKDGFPDNNNFKFYFWGILLSTIISVLIIGIPAGSRLFTNYNSFNFIFFPLVISHVKSKSIRYSYCIFIVSLFSFLYLTGGDPYKYYFMWEL